MDLPDFSKIFHQSSKDHVKGHPPVPADPQDWPAEWRTTYYKSYPRLPKIDLGGTPPPADLFELLKKRRSRRKFTRAPFQKFELSLLLKYSGGTTHPTSDGRYHRAHPSAGARFPIEIYPVVLRSGEDLEAGIYHYQVKNYALDILWERPFSDGDLDQLFSYSFVKDAALAIVMTAVFSRTQNRYGERGYRYILAEAGHIGQNIYLVAEALGLKCCALASTDDIEIERLLDIDGVTESLVYALAVGK